MVMVDWYTHQSGLKVRSIAPCRYLHRLGVYCVNMTRQSPLCHFLSIGAGSSQLQTGTWWSGFWLKDIRLLSFDIRHVHYPGTVFGSATRCPLFKYYKLAIQSDTIKCWQIPGWVDKSPSGYKKLRDSDWRSQPPSRSDNNNRHSFQFEAVSQFNTYQTFILHVFFLTNTCIYLFYKQATTLNRKNNGVKTFFTLAFVYSNVACILKKNLLWFRYIQYTLHS